MPPARYLPCVTSWGFVPRWHRNGLGPWCAENWHEAWRRWGWLYGWSGREGGAEVSSWRFWYCFCIHRTFSVVHSESGTFLIRETGSVPVSFCCGLSLAVGKLTKVGDIQALSHHGYSCFNFSITFDIIKHIGIWRGKLGFIEVGSMRKISLFIAMSLVLHPSRNYSDSTRWIHCGYQGRC